MGDLTSNPPALKLRWAKPATFSHQSLGEGGQQPATNHMSDTSTYESRTAKANCTAEELYHFVSDIRNFKRFIPEGKVSDMVIEKDSCSFKVNMLGKVNIRIRDKKEFTEVVFTGNAMPINEFTLDLRFHDSEKEKSQIRLIIQARLNPFLKMLAEEPIKRFMETIVTEIEKFNGWKEIRKDS